MLWHTVFVFSLCWLSIRSEPITQADIDAFSVFLDTNNPFATRKFTLVPTTLPRDFGYIGNVNVVATENIQDEEVIYRFSNSFVFPKHETKKDPETDARNNDFIDMLTLIYEKRKQEKSEWWPYLKIISSNFSTPIFWTEEEYNELAGTSIYDQLRRLNGTINFIFNEISQNGNFSRLFPDGNADVRADEWRWAYTVWRTRNWSTAKGAKISPVLELFNYGVEANVRVVAKENGLFELVANEDIEAGQPVFINDGSTGNRELLDWYGFVRPKNPFDYFPVGLGFDKDDKLYGMKRNLLKQRGLKDGQSYQLKRDLIPRDLVCALRIYHVNVYDYSEAENALQDRVISMQNEVSVCNTLIEMCEKTLAGLPHSLKDDKILLESEDLSANVRAAVTLRRSEKRIILSVLKLAKMQLADVKKLWDTRTFDIPTIRDQYM